MRLRRFLVLGGLALAACAQPNAEEAKAIRREFSLLLSPRFEAVRGPVPSQTDLRLILLVLQNRRASRNDFDSITALTFQSATRAIANFTWAAGSHGGGFILETRNGAWIIADEAFAV